MFVKTICPHCGELSFDDVSVYCLETILHSDFDSASRYAIENIEVKESLKIDELAQDIVNTLKEFVLEGTTEYEICKLLKSEFGFSENSIKSILQKIVAGLEEQNIKVTIE